MTMIQLIACIGMIAGLFICICVTAQTARENAGQESRRLRPTCDCHAPRSNGH